MDREKQKKLERERMEKERAEMAKDNGKKHVADEEGDGPRVPRKSKFVSKQFLALTIIDIASFGKSVNTLCSLPVVKGHLGS